MKNIAIITDLDWLESEISQKSARFVFESLTKLWYTCEIFYFNKDEEFFLQRYKEFNLAVPVVHWGIWESGELTVLLEKLGMEYCFSSSEAHKLCLDKYACNLAVQDFDLKIPKSYLIKNIEDLDYCVFENSFFVKPNKSWSSIDNGKFDNISDSKNLVSKILKYDDVLIQEFVKGREITIWISWNYDSEIEVLWIMEVITWREFFDYKAKYEWADTKEVFADLQIYLKDKIENFSLQIYKKLKLKTLARIDYILVWNDLYFLEVNTIPWMTEKSFIPQMFNKKFADRNFGDFLFSI